MKDMVSNRWIRVVALTAAMTVILAIFSPHGFPWMGLVWVSLAFVAALWVGRRPTRSIAQVIRDVEAEPMLAVAPRRSQ